MPGIIVQQLGPLTYMIEVSAGKFWKRHVDHVKDYPSKRLSSAPESPEVDNNDDGFFAPSVGVSGEESNASSEGSNNSTTSAPDSDPQLTSAMDCPTSSQVELPSRQYPERQQQVPSRYGINYILGLVMERCNDFVSTHK